MPGERRDIHRMALLLAEPPIAQLKVSAEGNFCAGCTRIMAKTIPYYASPK